MATKGDISTLDVLSYGGVPWVPLISGFSRSKRTGVVSSDIMTGPTRQRRKFYNTVYDASASFWCETTQQQDFLQIFMRRNQGKYFVCHLSADRPIVEPYVVQVIGTWDETEINAIDSLVSVPIEIISVPDLELDDYLFDLYQTYGDDLYNMLLGITNVTLRLP